MGGEQLWTRRRVYWRVSVPRIAAEFPADDRMRLWVERQDEGNPLFVGDAVEDTGLKPDDVRYALKRFERAGWLDRYEEIPDAP